MANRKEPPEKIVEESDTPAFQNLTHTIDVICQCLGSVDLDAAVKQITKELPALFGATMCTLFVCDDDSGIIQFLSSHKRHSCSANGCSPWLKDYLPSKDQWIACHNSDDDLAPSGGCFVIRLRCPDAERSAPRNAKAPDIYLCVCGFRGADDPNTEQVYAKAKLVRDILGPHVHGARLYRQAHKTSLTDAMTGVGSRQLIEDKLEQECMRTRRYGRPLSLAIIDLDNFKSINDVLGHVTGDEALRELAKCLKTQKRESDVLARYGGDEFVILMPETTAGSAAVLLERLRTTIKTLEIAEDVSMTVSSGIAQSTGEDVTTPRELFQRADIALYEAKNAGKDRVVVWDKGMSKLLSDKDMEIEKIKKLQRRIAGLSEKSEKMFIQSIWGLVQALEAKDPYSRKHSENVTEYAVRIAELMGMGDRQIEVIRHAAMIHDIGKIGIPDAILAKPDKLTRREHRIMEQHPVIAVQILEKMTFLAREVEIVKHHHEAWNGLGYPDGLAGPAIPMGARILAVADTLDALTSDRPYRRSYSVPEAAKILVDSSEYDFDPDVVAAAMRWIDTIRSSLDETDALKPENLQAEEPLSAAHE